MRATGTGKTVSLRVMPRIEAAVYGQRLLLGAVAWEDVPNSVTADGVDGNDDSVGGNRTFL